MKVPWTLLLFTLFSGLQSIYAQSNASCLPFYSWTFNLQGETPCDVAASLLAVCNHGSFWVVALPDSMHYLGPSMGNTNPCQCNTVTYSLMSACAACQGRTYLSWSVWSMNCATVYLNSYPELIPSGTSVPGWAYLDVEASDNFEQIRAKDNANLTESTAIPSPTSHAITAGSQVTTTTTNGSVSTLASALRTPTPTVDSDLSMLDARANAVGGAVVGGLFGLLILCSIVFWIVRHRQSQGSPLKAPPDPSPQDSGLWTSQGPYMAKIPLHHKCSLSANSLLPIPPRSAAQSNVSETQKSMSSVQFQV